MPGQSVKSAKLNIALHCQSHSSRHTAVAGSEITTAGLAAALKQDPAVGVVEIFAPYKYEALFSTRYRSLNWGVLTCGCR